MAKLDEADSPEMPWTFMQI